jgi:hypothetical protein
VDIQVLSEQQRQYLYESHPVITKNYLVITPVVRKAYALIRDRVYMRTTGTFMYAAPRVGKTTCARATQQLLLAEFPRIHVMRFSAEPSRQQSALLQDILTVDNLSIPKSPRYKELQRQLLIHIQSNLAIREGNQFVLIADEMQNLSEDNLVDLATIHNRLETLGIRMTTIGFAQPEIMDRHTALLATNQSFLIARFLSEPIPFSGCTSIEDLSEILNAYDLTLKYPVDCDHTYTRFFLPLAYDNGFRLASNADTIWSKLRIAAKGLSVDSIPMEHLSRTVEFLLVYGAASDSRAFKLEEKTVEDAVEASNLRYFSGLLCAPSD